MSLVPIVYASLVLFFGLLIIVTAISYLTFKTRTNTNPVIEEEIKNQQKKFIVLRQNHYLAQQLQIQQQNSVITKPNYAYQNNSTIDREVQIPPSNYFQNTNSEKVYTNSTERHQIEARNFNTVKRKETKLNILSSERRTSNRIKIMNDSPKYFRDTNTLPSERYVPKIQPSFGEYNYLNFYSDNTETRLSNITAAQNKAV